MNPKEYPKTLIIGPSFNRQTGGGITLSNLFFNWPKDRIASISYRKNEDWTICKIQYLIGKDEIQKRWPFSLMQDNIPSQIYSFQKDSNLDKKPISTLKSSVLKDGSSMRLILRRYTKSFLKFIGIFLFLNRTKISNKLAFFIETFKPDIIYSQLADLEIIKFVDKISDRYKLPIVIHIMDDWPVIINREGLLGKYLNKYTHDAFKRIVTKSALCFAISDSMGVEYKRRYNRDWITFHNPVEGNVWENKREQNSIPTNNINRLLYIGRVGIANIKSLFFILDTAEEIRTLNDKFEFYIYTPDFENSLLINKVNNYDYIKVLPPVPHNKVPEILSSAGLLILPLDFDKTSKKFARFSMPTKATEYMASGVPILIFAPAGNAVTEYARNTGWGYVVDKVDSNLLKSAIIELISNRELRNNLVQNARTTVFNRHNAVQVREQLRKAFQIAAKNEKE